MKEWLTIATEHAIVTIDALALVIIVVGTVEVVLASVWLIVTRASGQDQRDVWLRYARWLVAALTFQLAADIVETSISTGWEAIARIAAIALIRTFLNYFLEKDLAEVRERQREASSLRAGAPP